MSIQQTNGISRYHPSGAQTARHSSLVRSDRTGVLSGKHAMILRQRQPRTKGVGKSFQRRTRSSGTSKQEPFAFNESSIRPSTRSTSGTFLPGTEHRHTQAQSMRETPKPRSRSEESRSKSSDSKDLEPSQSTDAVSRRLHDDVVRIRKERENTMQLLQTIDTEIYTLEQSLRDRWAVLNQTPLPK